MRKSVALTASVAVAAGLAAVTTRALQPPTAQAASPRAGCVRVGPSPRALAVAQVRGQAATAHVKLALVQTNAVLGHGRTKTVNLTVRLAGAHRAYQLNVLLQRQDWHVIDVRPFNRG